MDMIITTNTMAINKTKCKKIAWIIFEHILLSRMLAIMAMLMFSSRFFRDLSALPIYLLYLLYLCNFGLEIILRIILRKNKNSRKLIISYKIASHCFIFTIIMLHYFRALPYDFLHSNFFYDIMYLIILLLGVVTTVFALLAEILVGKYFYIL
jgi:hypothetical protein